MIATIRNRELGIFELLSFGWNIFINNLDAILMIIFLIDLPVSLFSTIAQTLDYREIPIPIVINILISYTLCLSGMAVIFLAEQYISNEKIQYSKALKKSFSRLGFGWAAGFKSSWIVLFLLFFFIIPGIIYWIKYYFVFHACILREKGSTSALAYSSSLVKGRLFRSFFTIISLIFIIFLPAILVNICLSYLLPQNSEILYTNLVYNVLFEMIFMLAFYFFTVVNTVFFLNLDYRK